MMLVSVVLAKEVAAGRNNGTSSSGAPSNKDKRDASLLSKGYPTHHQQRHQVSVVPSIEVASGSYYESDQRGYGSPEAHQLFQSNEHYASPNTDYAGPPSAQFGQQQQQQQPHYPQPYLVGTYGPPTAVQYQGNEEPQPQLGAQSNQAPQVVHGSSPHQYMGAAPVQSVHLPSAGFGSPVVGASLSFAGPQSQYHTAGFGGFGGQSGAGLGGHSFTASPPSPVYGSPFGYGGEQRPQFARQQQQPPQQHRFGPSPLRTQSHHGASFGRAHVSPFAQQNYRGAGAATGAYSHFAGGAPSFAHPPRNYGPPSTQYRDQAALQSFPGAISSAPYHLGHQSAQLIDDGYGSGPSYATGTKGLGHYTAASHSSNTFAHPPKGAYYRSPSSQYNAGPAASPSKNTFKPSAYLGSTDLSATSQTTTYVLPSTEYGSSAAVLHDRQSSYASGETVAPPQHYNTIQYSAV